MSVPLERLKWPVLPPMTTATIDPDSLLAVHNVSLPPPNIAPVAGEEVRNV